MEIKLTKKKVDNLTMRSILPDETEQDQQFHIKIGCTVYGNANNKNIVRIRYPVIVSVKDKATLSMDYDFYFTLSEELTEDFNTSIVTRQTAPALAYPYIKSYVENFLSISGYGDIDLPFLDFIKNPFEFDDE
ncbi:hypothetical protein AB7V66_20540 [Providencia rettgeri]|uniref:hypothetical protein n=1 Tax=Providencia rettgeri TaxID=587 RepID=UPI001EF65041|nr:hypothetical protein [Providencia rettgeri]CAB5566685.1 Uncharacterised protein [Providencia rettgeri]CAC9132237.1 Uncharacterised protein [Providencia rettgeri]